MFNKIRLIVFLVLAAALTQLVPATAHAQRPALVRSVDEPGRAPYQHSVGFVQSQSTCDQYSCMVRFPKVPAGYRLVITHASAFFWLTNGAITDANVALVSDGDIFGNTLQLPPPAVTGGKLRVVSSPVTYYVEPGSTPCLSLGASGMATNYMSASAAIVGYLVAIP